MSDSGKPYRTSPTGRASALDGSALAAADLDRIGRGSHERRTSIGLRRREPGGLAPVLVGADFASIELRLLAAGTLGRLERGAGPLLVARPPAHPPADLEDLRQQLGPLLVSHPPRTPGGRRDTKPDNGADPAPVQEPIEVRCRPCGGRGWTHPSMVVGFHPRRCDRCKGTGKVLVR
jgi:hypothetical protein